MRADPDEKIIEDLLYEASARKYLNENKSGQKRPVYKYIMGIAAAILIGMFLLTSIQNNNLEKRSLLIQQSHDFPLISKSRSAEINIVDDHIKDLNAKKYGLVLEQLAANNLSEKDAYVKAQILFNQGNYKALSQFLDTYKFEDPFYVSEIQWLNFLIEFRNGKSKKELLDFTQNLDADYAKKASDLLSKHFK